jgi:hypothetical protein
MNRHVNEIIKDALWKCSFYLVYSILIALLIIKFVTYVLG